MLNCLFYNSMFYYYWILGFLYSCRVICQNDQEMDSVLRLDKMMNISLFKYKNDNKTYGYHHLDMSSSILNKTYLSDLLSDLLLNESNQLKNNLSSQQLGKTHCKPLILIFPNTTNNNYNSIHQFFTSYSCSYYFVINSMNSSIIPIFNHNQNGSIQYYQQLSTSTISTISSLLQKYNDQFQIIIQFPNRHGFHNVIQLIGMFSHLVSKLSIIFPKGIYIDKDELYEKVSKGLLPSFETYPSFINIESPNEVSNPFLLVFSFSPTHQLNITIPIHLRYSFASNQFQTILYSIHTVFVTSVQTDKTSLIMRVLPFQPIHFTIPIGNLSHLSFVFPITVIVVMGCTLLILYSLFY